MNKTQASPAAARNRHAAASASAQQGETIRDSIEAVIVAVILTLTFRTFLGENYQIPTGSMAPTLQGRHMDVVCPSCEYQYRTGASRENEMDGRRRGEVLATVCPICRWEKELNKEKDLNERSFSGDRIIVNKLAYLFAEPKRWDVLVFKYPGDAKVNYIKRLVGLPGESLKIRHGDLFTLNSTTGNESNDRQDYQIARKPPEKVEAMLQIVDDSYHVPEPLMELGWPERWDVMKPGDDTWQGTDEAMFASRSTPTDSWLGYRHLLLRQEDSESIRRGGRPDLTGYHGRLITDYYEYNDGLPNPQSNSDGWNWVGDLAVDAHVEVVRPSGELLIDLVEGGIHHRCRIDLATGRAVVSLDDGRLKFLDAAGKEHDSAAAQTTINGAGSYRVRFANVDDQLLLWVDGKVVSFDQPTTFQSPADLRPQWSEEEPADIVPVRIGVRQAEVRVNRLRVLRDVYYIASRYDEWVGDSDYSDSWQTNFGEILRVLSDPHSWSQTTLFSSRREQVFTLGPDQFFPMGDNSPESKDGRLWSVVTARGVEPPPYVSRELLIGKAVFVYWPHSWNFPRIPFMIPNFQRIGRIR